MLIEIRQTYLERIDFMEWGWLEVYLVTKYNWMSDTVVVYNDKDHLLSNFKKAVIDRALMKHKELQNRKITTFDIKSIDQFLSDLTKAPLEENYNLGASIVPQLPETHVHTEFFVPVLDTELF